MAFITPTLWAVSFLEPHHTSLFSCPCTSRNILEPDIWMEVSVPQFSSGANEIPTWASGVPSRWRIYRWNFGEFVPWFLDPSARFQDIKIGQSGKRKGFGKRFPCIVGALIRCPPPPVWGGGSPGTSVFPVVWRHAGLGCHFSYSMPAGKRRLCRFPCSPAVYWGNKGRRYFSWIRHRWREETDGWFALGLVT